MPRGIHQNINGARGPDDDDNSVNVTPFTIGGNTVSNHFDLDLNERLNEPFNLSGSNVMYVNPDAEQQQQDLQNQKAQKKRRLQDEKLEQERKWLEKQFFKKN